MRDVFEEAVTLSGRQEPFAIATVVRTRGSTPQKPGSKLLVRRDGSGVGTLGGGCVEGDIWFAAQEILRHDGGPEYRDYYLNEDVAARDGLVCGGTMYFFIDPFWKVDKPSGIAQEIMNAYDGGDPVALATLIKPGLGGGVIGVKFLIRGTGQLSGTLGRPELDKLAIQTANKLSEHGHCQHVVATDGTELFVEAYTSPATVLIMGGGHIGKAVAPLVDMLGFRLFVLDDRTEFANKQRFPKAEMVVVSDYAHGLDNFHVTPNTAIIIATRGHNFDGPALEAAVRSDAGYVGLVGSQRKIILLYENLLKEGVTLDQIRKVRAPVGLDIRARTPEEIAVSIMAELVQFRLGGTAQPMKLPEKQIMRIYDKVKEVGIQTGTLGN